jgi:hypothetical protein
MGGSFGSPKSSPKNRSIVDFTKEYTKDLNKVDKTNSEAIDRLKKWKVTLQRLIEDPKYAKTKGWIKIQEDFLLFVKGYDGKSKGQVDWLMNAQFTETRNQTNLFNPNLKKAVDLDLLVNSRKSMMKSSGLADSTNNNNNIPNLKKTFDFDNLTKESAKKSVISDRPSHQISVVTTQESENMRLLQSISRETSCVNGGKKSPQMDSPSLSMIMVTSPDSARNINTTSNKTGNNLKILLETIEKQRPSAKKELINHLKVHLCESSSHVLWDLAAVFKKSFSAQYKHYLSDVNREQFVARHATLLTEIRTIVRQVKRIFKKFMEYLYKNKINELSGQLEHEDQDCNVILNSVVYQLLFDDQDSNQTHYRVIYELLKIKNEEVIKRFKEVTTEIADKTINEYDELLKPLFHLQNIERPYEPVVRVLNSLHATGLNPYHKFELVSLWEEELMKYLESVFLNANEQENLEKMMECFKEPDQKIPILNFNIIQSKNEKLIIDIDFIHTFVNKKFTEERVQFITFSGCLLDYISNGEILEKFKVTLPAPVTQESA